MKDLTQINWDFLDKYFTGDKLAYLRRCTQAGNMNSHETHKWATVKHGWSGLIWEVEAAIKGGVNPKSDEAKALADRWNSLAAIFSDGNKKIQAAWEEMYKDRSKLSANLARLLPSDAVRTFIKAASA